MWFTEVLQVWFTEVGESLKYNMLCKEGVNGSAFMSWSVVVQRYCSHSHGQPYVISGCWTHYVINILVCVIV